MGDHKSLVESFTGHGDGDYHRSAGEGCFLAPEDSANAAEPPGEEEGYRFREGRPGLSLPAVGVVGHLRGSGERVVSWQALWWVADTYDRPHGGAEKADAGTDRGTKADFENGNTQIAHYANTISRMVIPDNLANFPAGTGGAFVAVGTWGKAVGSLALQFVAAGRIALRAATFN